MENNGSRRGFMTNVGAATGLMIAQSRAARGSQANSAITLGLIGCGNRGMYVSGLFAKNEFARVAAVCDIYKDRIEEARKKYSGAQVFTDYKELLNSNVDAVLIATPAYLHPEHFEAAVNARKHIFMEKPAGVDAAGCRRVKAAALRADPTKRITVDYQQRYGTEYRRAYDVVRSGELGAIQMVRAAWLGGGPAIKSGHPADEEKVRNWFFYRELSGDILVEQDCHNVDVVNWFMGMHPVKASGYGSRRLRQYGDIFDNVACTFQFADGRVFSYSANQFGTPGFQDVSETFMCDYGAVNVSRRGYTIWRGKQPEERVQTKYDITADAVNDFVDGVRNGRIENMGVSAAESTLTAVMALTACASGREVTWEEMSEA
ncbi:MAG: Gfo/Idh/MocA family oxidoreductase [Bryobacteraceae bacterium]|nr:Gfo/Idh/MocA family oxidoreductase [Bryobacteraceae bacterium]